MLEWKGTPVGMFDCMRPCPSLSAKYFNLILAREKKEKLVTLPHAALSLHPPSHCYAACVLPLNSSLPTK